MSKLIPTSSNRPFYGNLTPAVAPPIVVPLGGETARALDAMHVHEHKEKGVLRIIRVAAAVFAIAPALTHAADMASAEFINIEGAIIGKATFEQTPTGVLMSVDVRGLPPGPHGIHLHATGSCAPDFKAATGHINPEKFAHGLPTREDPTTATCRTSTRQPLGPRGRSSSRPVSRFQAGICRRFSTRTARRSSFMRAPTIT